METRAKDDFLKRLCTKLQFDNWFIVPRINTGGGLVLYWKSKINLHVLNSSPRLAIYGFYGNLVTANREHSWALFKHLCLQINFPWLCIGDFNEIVKLEEKMGGAS